MLARSFTIWPLSTLLPFPLLPSFLIHPSILLSEESSIPPRRGLINNLPLDDTLLVPSTATTATAREREARFRGRRPLLLLIFDLADTFAALALDVLGDFDEAEDVLLRFFFG